METEVDGVLAWLHGHKGTNRTAHDAKWRPSIGHVSTFKTIRENAAGGFHAVERNRVGHVPAVFFGHLATAVFNISVHERTTDIEVAVFALLCEGGGDAAAVGVVSLVDAHARDADVIVNIGASRNHVRIGLRSVIAGLSDFTEVVPRGHVLVAFSRF